MFGVYLFHNRYVGNVPSSKAENMLKDLFDGVYLVREDNENRGEYELCIKYINMCINNIVSTTYFCRWKGKPYHITIFVDPKTNCFYLTKEKMFSTIYVSNKNY